MGAFRLAAKGKTMADSSYDSEVHGIEAFLDMQRNKDKFSNSTASGGVRIYLFYNSVRPIFAQALGVQSKKCLKLL